MADELIRAGADLNIRNADGMTPLQKARELRNDAFAEKLASYGAK